MAGSRRVRASIVLAVLGLGCGLESVEPGAAGVLIVAPANADATTERLTETTRAYVERIAGGAPQVVSVAGSYEDILGEARDRSAGLVIVLEADRVAPGHIDDERLASAGEWGFVLQAQDEGSWTNRLGSQGATVVLAAGESKLGRQYAAYETLRRLGARFFHPEQEYIPEHALEDLRALAKRPTALQRTGDEYRPDFEWRSWSFHGSHPLEQLEAFSDADHPIDEAVAVNDWQVKNFGNRFRGRGRGVSSEPSRAQRGAELEDLRQLLGFPRGTGITLHNQQQGASAEIDRESDVPVREQIESLVAARAESTPDARWFGIHFGPTEFTTTPDEETVQWLNWAGDEALRLLPEARVEINNHITGSQPSPNYDDLGCDNGTGEGDRIDYYDLSFHTDPRLGVRVHTVMFYPLEGPARVYNQQSFNHKLCLMEKASALGRPLAWFPEGGWWLSFDNPIPVYLPLHVWTRARDVELVRPLLAARGSGTVIEHRMFNTGHEWGYWQQDYAVGLAAFNADVTVQQILGELFDPLCPPGAWADGCSARDEAIAVLTELMDHQRELFLEREDWSGRPGGLYAYFAGEDQADIIAAESGFEFRPVRVAFDEVLRWDEPELEHFRQTDLAALAEADAAYAGWLARLQAARDEVPSAGLPWIDEVIDGVEIDMLRARQAHALYAVIVARAQAEHDEEDDPDVVATEDWARAQATLAAAEVVIRRREASYRYPAAQTHGGGLTAQTGVANGTTYPYRVHTKTHLLTYWHDRHDEVAAILGGQSAADTDRVVMRDAIASVDEPLTIEWPDLIGLTAEVEIGSAAKIGVDQTTVELVGAGWFAVSGSMETEGRIIDVSGGVARSPVLAVTPASGLTLVEPDDPIVQGPLSSVFPALQWAWMPDGSAIVFGADDDGDGVAPFARVVRAEVTDTEGAAFTTQAVAFGIPVALSGGSVIDVGMRNVVLSGRVAGGVIEHPIALDGEISIPDLIDALAELAAFDEQGSLELLGPILGFDPADPPETVPVRAELDIEPPASR